MRAVTIISDWKKADYYMAVMHGVLYNGSVDIQVIDLSNQVETYKIEQAAYILKSSYRFYPEGTIHIVAVKAEPDEGERYLAVKWENQYFIFSDNGFFSLFWSENLPEEVYELGNITESIFPEAEIMAKAAVNIHKKNDLSDYIKFNGELLRKTPQMPWFEDNVITGVVAHTDSYGNAVTNVSHDYFEKYIGEKTFQILPGSSYYSIRKICRHYNEVSVSDQIALFNMAGLLEIAIRNGSARDLLGLKEGTNIRIEIL